MKREMIQVSGNVRVENGPVMKTAVASTKMLSNAVTPARYQLGGKDSLGKKIIQDQEFSYLDDRGDWEWKVYQDVDGRYQKVDAFKTKEEAIEYAYSLEV